MKFKQYINETFIKYDDTKKLKDKQPLEPSKKYKCLNCKHEFRTNNKEAKCVYCGSDNVLQKE